MGKFINLMRRLDPPLALMLTQQMLLMLLDMDRFRWSVAALNSKVRKFTC